MAVQAAVPEFWGKVTPVQRHTMVSLAFPGYSVIHLHQDLDSCASSELACEIPKGCGSITTRQNYCLTHTALSLVPVPGLRVGILFLGDRMISVCDTVTEPRIEPLHRGRQPLCYSRSHMARSS